MASWFSASGWPALGSAVPGGLRRFEKTSVSFVRDLSWSPDGRTLSWAEGLCSVAVASVHGDGYRYVAARPKGRYCLYSPAWSPDSNQIALGVYGAGPAIALISGTGRGFHLITPVERGTAIAIGPPAWQAANGN